MARSSREGQGKGIRSFIMLDKRAAMPRRIGGICPRCDVCGRVVRVRRVGIKDMLCTNCLGVDPFLMKF